MNEHPPRWGWTWEVLVPTGQEDQPVRTAGQRGREHQGEKVVTHVSRVSPLEPASQGSSWDQSKSFAGEFSLLPQPKQPTLLCGAEGRFEVLGLDQQPLSSHMTLVAVDLLT